MVAKMKAEEKSGRKPLRDLSNENGETSFLKSRVTLQEQIQNCRVLGVDEEDFVFDRLLLVHNDLSSLVQEIDKIVVHAFNLEEMSMQGREEVVSFTNVLSGTISSLKPRVTTFQKVFSHHPTKSDDELTGFLIDGRDQTKTQRLVSSSPFVSWCANSTVERGEQLFVLTPLLTSKALPSKPHIPTTRHGDKGLNQTHWRPTDSQTEVTSIDRHEVPSPQVILTKNCSMVVVTPSFKMSPPKSCILLEPIYEFSNREAASDTKSTPFHSARSQFSAEHYSSSSDSDTFDRLVAKYSKLLEVNRDSPYQLLSPLKTCVLLDLSDEELQDIVGVDAHPRLQNQDANTILTKNCIQDFHSKNIDEVVLLAESTLMTMENGSESFIRAGKLASESTLKKELWAKFEEASSKPYRFNVSAVKKSPRKTFLDLLDEISCQDETQM